MKEIKLLCTNGITKSFYVLSEYHGSGVGRGINAESNWLLAQKMQPDYLWLDTHVSNGKGSAFTKRTDSKK